MAYKATYKVKMRRRRDGKTNYKKRLALVKSGKHRFVARKTNSRIIAQVIEFNLAGDKVIASADSGELGKLGWNCAGRNIPSAYLTGLLCGKRAVEKKVTAAVFDMGFRTPVHGSIPFAVLKGAIDAKVDIPFDEKSLPSGDRISGKHIEDYAKKLDLERKKVIFSGYLKNKVDPATLTQLFQKTKESILGGVSGK